MTIFKHIKKQQQTLMRCEKDYALKQIKQRRADTRRKIELGGLVIKAGMNVFNKAVILGALDYAVVLLAEDNYSHLFETRGNYLFLDVKK